MSATDYAVVDPATGETVKTYETISDEGLKDAIARGHAAHPAWGRGTTVEERAKIIARVADLPTARRQRLAEIIRRGARKAPRGPVVVRGKNAGRAGSGRVPLKLGNPRALRH